MAAPTYSDLEIQIYDLLYQRGAGGTLTILDIEESCYDAELEDIEAALESLAEEGIVSCYQGDWEMTADGRDYDMRSR